MNRTFEIAEPPAEILEFFDLLRARGFNVSPTPFERTDSQKKNVWRITWRYEYVAQAAPGLWNAGSPMLYRFMPWDKPKGGAGFPCPKPFDIHAFAKERDCSAAALDQRQDGPKGESYLKVLDVETALKLLDHSAARLDEALYPPTLRGAPSSVLADLAAIGEDKDLTDPERVSLRDARCGQGKFRADLDKEFAGCGVTGLQERAALRASHIVPWRDASKREKTDPQNGLLLSANVDALFDRYLLTVRPDGTVHLSSTISAGDRDRLSLPPALQAFPINAARGIYLSRHNAIFDRREKAAQARRVKLGEDASD